MMQVMTTWSERISIFAGYSRAQETIPFNANRGGFDELESLSFSLSLFVCVCVISNISKSSILLQSSHCNRIPVRTILCVADSRGRIVQLIWIIHLVVQSMLHEGKFMRKVEL